MRLLERLWACSFVLEKMMAFTIPRDWRLKPKSCWTCSETSSLVMFAYFVLPARGKCSIWYTCSSKPAKNRPGDQHTEEGSAAFAWPMWGTLWPCHLTIDDHKLVNTDNFSYLGSIISNATTIEEEISLCLAGASAFFWHIERQSLEKWEKDETQGISCSGTSIPFA